MDIAKVTDDINESLDREPRAVTYAALRGGDADLTMDGAEHLRQEQLVMLLAAQVRRLSDIFGVHEGVIAHEAASYAIDVRDQQDGGGE